MMKKSEKTFRFQLTSDLQSLRKGSGLVIRKLHTTPTLRHIVAKHIGTTSDQVPISQAQQFLLHEVQTLGESIEARALRNAFAIGNEDNPRKLTERRAVFAQQAAKHPDTIELYENHAIELLVERLMSVGDQPVSRQRAQLVSRDTKAERMSGVARNMITQGLAEMYDLGSHAAEIHRLLGNSSGAYLDADVECALLPSSRGSNWYTYKLRYLFRMQKTRYRIGIVTTANDSEILMAAGVVDDTIKLDSASHLDKEMAVILRNCGFMIHDVEVGTKVPLQFIELGKSVRSGLLSELWQIDAEACRIIEIDIPVEHQKANNISEYRWSFDLPINGEHYAYWSAPGLMYLKTITIDARRFPQRDQWRIYMQPFLGAVSPGALEPDGDLYILSAGSWIMRGHGVMLTWQPKT